jgi:hypothetical protein
VSYSGAKIRFGYDGIALLFRVPKFLHALQFVQGIYEWGACKDLVFLLGPGQTYGVALWVPYSRSTILLVTSLGLSYDAHAPFLFKAGLGASSVYSISIAEFEHIGFSLSHRSGARFGDAVSVFEFLVPGSSLSLRAFMHLRLSAFGC